MITFTLIFSQPGPGIDLLTPVVLAEALALDHDAVTQRPGHLVVGDQDVPAALGEDAAGAPGSRDSTAVEVVVGDGDVLVVVVAQLEESMVADVSEDVPLDHHLGAEWSTLIGRDCRDTVL